MIVFSKHNISLRWENYPETNDDVNGIIDFNSKILYVYSLFYSRRTFMKFPIIFNVASSLGGNKRREFDPRQMFSLK